jgi:hypothetical protein
VKVCAAQVLFDRSESVWDGVLHQPSCGAMVERVEEKGSQGAAIAFAVLVL